MKEAKITRQSAQNRIVHWGVAISIFGLIFSGILQMPITVSVICSMNCL